MHISRQTRSKCSHSTPFTQWVALRLWVTLGLTFRTQMSGVQEKFGSFGINQRNERERERELASALVGTIRAVSEEEEMNPNSAAARWWWKVCSRLPTALFGPALLYTANTAARDDDWSPSGSGRKKGRQAGSWVGVSILLKAPSLPHGLMEPGDHRHRRRRPLTLSFHFIVHSPPLPSESTSDRKTRRKVPFPSLFFSPLN